MFIFRYIYYYLICDIIIYFFNFFMFKYLFLIIFFLLTVYWLMSMFIYLYNSTKLSKNTTSVISFWRRSFIIFWLIEGYLFILYVYLLLNCSVETEWLADQKQMFESRDYMGVFCITDLLTSLTVLTLLYILTKNFFFKKKIFSILTLTLLVVISIKIFWNEFFQFFLFTQYFHYYNLSFDKSVNVWVYEVSYIPFKVLHQYLFLMVFLKFWHTLLIFLVFFLQIRFFYNNPLYSTSNFFKLSLYNFLIFMIFCFFVILFYIKFYMNYSYGYVYYWFFVNNETLINYPTNLINIFVKLVRVLK